MKPGKVDTAALKELRASKRMLTKQQYKTLRGQILAGDPRAAIKGLRNILRRQGDGMTVSVSFVDELEGMKKEGAEP